LDDAKKVLKFSPYENFVELKKKNYEFFLSLPDPNPITLGTDSKSFQFERLLFEYSGACASCGETPYLKLLTQMFGDRLLIANATGFSSVYERNLPTTRYCTNTNRRGPAWANSLFEDNTEFGFDISLATNQKHNICLDILISKKSEIGEKLIDSILSTQQTNELEIAR
jgi:pyruvate-ferredoxin/flavodoxin oxidoreductase